MIAPDSIFTTLSTPLGVEISDNCRDCAPDNRQIDNKISIMLWQTEWIHYYCFDSRIPQKGLDNRLLHILRRMYPKLLELGCDPCQGPRWIFRIQESQSGIRQKCGGSELWSMLTLESSPDAFIWQKLPVPSRAEELNMCQLPCKHFIGRRGCSHGITWDY